MDGPSISRKNPSAQYILQGFELFHVLKAKAKTLILALQSHVTNDMRFQFITPDPLRVGLDQQAQADRPRWRYSNLEVARDEYRARGSVYAPCRIPFVWSLLTAQVLR